MKTLINSAFAFLAAAACGSDKISGPSGPIPVSLNFCGFAPEWFAVQNEGSGWQRAQAGSDGIISFGATSKVSIALQVGTGEFGFFSTQIINTTAEELQAEIQCEGDFGSRTLTGTVAGLTGEQVARLYVTTQSDGADVNNPNFLFEFLPNTALDLVALRSPSLFSAPPDRVIVRRALASTANPIPTVDFGGTEAVPLGSAVLTIGNMGSDAGQIRTDLTTTNNTFATISDMSLSSGVGAVAYYSLPTSLRVDSDLNALSLVASSSVGTREILNYFKAPVDKTLNLGPQLNAPVLTQVAATPYVRMTATLASQSEYPTAAEVGFVQGTPSSFRTIDILTTASFLGGTPTTWEFTIPDFSGTGYQNSWGLQAGTVSWQATGFDAAGGVLGVVPADGVTITTASRSAPLAATAPPTASLVRRGARTPLSLLLSRRARRAAR